MSFQVGAFCYATSVDAGRAACSQFQNVSSLSPTQVQTVSCSGVDPASGSLLLNISSVDVGTGASSVQVVAQQISFPPCVQQDYLDALEYCAGGVLTLWGLYIGYMHIVRLIESHRGSE